jgi:hypothetical protein
MAHLGISRILTTKITFAIQGYDRCTSSLHDDVGHLGRERTLSAGRKTPEKEGDEQRRTPPKTIIVEQWICVVLGFVCMTFGFWGICMKPGQHALSTYIAWLGSLYVPALRVTAVACLGMGLVLLRRGWTHL